MPWSETGRRPWVLSQLRQRGALDDIFSVVDAGAGSGGWHTFLAPSLPGAIWTVIEIHEPYITRFRLRERYGHVMPFDLRDLDPFPRADLVIFGDVLEHMVAADAVTVWNRAREASRWLVLALPVLPYPQGEVEGNPHEAHLHDWDIPSVLESFAGIVAHCGPPAVPPGQTAGAFVAEGLR